MIGLYDCKRKDIYSFDSIYPDGPFMSTCDDTSFYRKSLLLPLLLMFLPPTVIINVPMGVYRSACRKSGGCGTGFYATQPYRRTNLPEPFKGKNVFIFFWTQGWGKALSSSPSTLLNQKVM
jgi:hypothetical protein